MANFMSIMLKCSKALITRGSTLYMSNESEIPFEIIIDHEFTQFALYFACQRTAFCEQHLVS